MLMRFVVNLLLLAYNFDKEHQLFILSCLHLTINNDCNSEK